MLQDATPEGYVVAGARVLRGFNRADGRVSPGTLLTADEYQAILGPSRRVMVKNGQIEPFFALRGTPGVDVKRYIIHRGAGRYDVIEGTLLTQEWVTKEEAEALAAKKE
jgi:hypothetical protein